LQHEQVVTAPLPTTLVNIGMYCQQSLALNAGSTRERIRRADELNMAMGVAATDETLASVSDCWHFLPAAATCGDFVAHSRAYCWCNRVHDVTGDATHLRDMIMCTAARDPEVEAAPHCRRWYHLACVASDVSKAAKLGHDGWVCGLCASHNELARRRQC
jgi:hypothetical protein